MKWISVIINFRSQFQGNLSTISFKLDQNCFKTYKYCDNTCKYYTCRWTHFSSIGSILVSITSILTSIATILASIEQVNTPLVRARLRLEGSLHDTFTSSSKLLIFFSRFLCWISCSFAASSLSWKIANQCKLYVSYRQEAKYLSTNLLQ